MRLRGPGWTHNEPAKKLIWLPETGPGDGAAITTAEINSGRKRAAVPEIAMWLCLSAMPLMLAATLPMVGSAASGRRFFFLFFGQARAVAHQGGNEAQGNLANPKAGGLKGAGWCFVFGWLEVTAFNQSVWRAARSPARQQPGRCDSEDFIYSSLFLFISVLCVFAVQFILAQHPLHQPDPGQHQSRRQQLPADLHRWEHRGDDQLVHTAQRPV